MSDITYTVKISRKTRFVGKSRSWNKIADSGNKEDNGAVYDYVETDSWQSREDDILVQEGLLDLDLPAVIAAVNKLNLAEPQP